MVWEELTAEELELLQYINSYRWIVTTSAMNLWGAPTKKAGVPLHLVTRYEISFIFRES